MEVLAIRAKDYKMPSRNLIVGVFVLAGLTLFTLGVFLIGDRHEAFARHIEFYTEFKDLDGVAKGSKVKVAGMDAGQIVEVGVPDNPSSRFRVKFRINQGLHGLVRTDSVVTIATEGVVGGTYLLVRPGSAKSLAANPLATLPSQEPIDMSKLLDRGMALVQDADTTLNQVGPKLNGALDQVTTTVANANDVVIGLKQGRGPAGMLLRDEAVATDIRGSVTNVKQATASVRDASGQANALVSDLRSRGVTGKVDETISSARDATANIDESSKQISKTIASATAPDEKGVDAGTNVRESLSKLNTTTANTVDDTEALKHNFFLRGFFNRRGYYNMANLPPDAYRKDRTFTDPANQRAWLPATELFRKDGSNSEILSSGGERQLNVAISEYGDAVVNHPIVVEGYSDGADNADQVASSRNRAILVREYLEHRFQLDPSKVGIVSMRNSPPEGVGHSRWDGVCVVFLKRQE
jgi:phospholipid/cholesterol/gamma-HCH transport system substrate-binding protein